jgi:3-isopropylmalate/(R)-2-methylmalate dehydratase small subunit
LKNSLLPIEVPPEVHAELLAAAPDATVKFDLAAQTVTTPSGRKVEFPIDGFAKHCLLEGVDELGYILKRADDIAAYEQSHAAPINTLG